MEEEINPLPAEEWRYCSGRRAMSPEIVEIGEDSRSNSTTGSRDASTKDVYVAVGKDDLVVLKWALDHAVTPGARVFLVHVFPSITFIPTPVGRLSRSQLSEEQVKLYMKEENNRRRHLLHKYIRLCTDAKVTVDTLLLESSETAKSILELVAVLNITNLVIGTKRPRSSRRLRKGLGKGEFVQKNAPDFCEVTIVCDGKKVPADGQPGAEPVIASSPASSHRRAETPQPPERKFFDCICFSGKFN